MDQTSKGRLARFAKPLLVAVLLLATLLLVAMMIWPPINDVTTGETPEYPEIQPQVLRYSSDLVLERAAETVDGLDRWSVIDVDRGTGRITAEVRTRVFQFVDDVEIRIEPHGAGSLVAVRSHSRVGVGDFGKNARNIRRFQAALVESLRLARRGDEDR